MPDPLRVAVLISGRGSNLSALLDHQQDAGYRVVAVASNQASAAGLKHAEQAGVSTLIVDHKAFDDREAFDSALAQALQAHRPQLLVLAGFMRVLGSAFVTRYTGRMINIHPSLLPRFKGLHTHERALKAAVKRHGASVHYVTAELDGGPVIAQIELAVEPGDTPDSLAARLLPLEHRLLTTVVGWIAEGIVTYDQGQVLKDGQVLDYPVRLAGADA